MIRGIVFDLFDTLVDFDHARLSAVEHSGRPVPATTHRLFTRLEAAAATQGHALSIHDVVDLQREVDASLRVETLDRGLELPTTRRFQALLDRIGVVTPGLAEALTADYMDVLLEVVRTPDHHETVLAGLAVGYELGLCSNFSHGATARDVLSGAGLDAHLGTIVISEEIGVRKPRPQIFQAVAESMGIAPDEILHVGDSLEADVAGASAAGMRTVWLTRRIARPEEALETYSGPPPDFSLEDLLDLPVLAARLGAGA